MLVKKGKYKIQGILIVRVRNYEIEHLGERLTLLPRELGKERFCCAILYEQLANLAEDLFYKSISSAIKRSQEEERRQPGSSSVVTPHSNVASVRSLSDMDCNTLVNRVVGWAVDDIYEALLDHSSPITRTAMEYADDPSDVCSFVACMAMSHQEAITMEQYMKEYYTLDLQLLNRGKLKLIRPEMFRFARRLIFKVCEFDATDIKKQGNESAAIAFEQLNADTVLLDLFLEGATDLLDNGEGVLGADSQEEGCRLHISEHTKLAIFRSILSKTFHALVGRSTQKLIKEWTARKLGAARFQTELKVKSSKVKKKTK
jgi:cation transport regulator ChaB